MRLLLFSLMNDILLSRLSCYSQFVTFFFCSKIESRTSFRAFFSNAIITVFICFHRKNCYEVSGTSLSSVSAFCFMQFHVGRFGIPPDHVRLVFGTFLANLKFTSKLNRCILKTIYIEQITSL